MLWIIMIIGIYYTQIWHTLSGDWQRPRFNGDPTLPFLGEAVARTATAIGGTLILLCSAALLGGWLCRRLGSRFADRGEAVAVGASLGIGCFAYAALLLSFAGLYQVWVLRVLVIVPIVVSAWQAARSRPSFHIPPRVTLHRPTLVWQLCALAAVGTAFIAALAPEREYDALWYHLSYPQRFLQQGSIVDDPNDYVSLYPWTWELWFGYGLVWGGPIGAKLLHFTCLPLTALVTWSMTRRFVPAAPAWLAVAIFVTVPTVMWEASTAYIDLALALHVALLIYALLRYVESEARQWLLIAAFNGGMALATKHLALVVVGLACIGMTLHGWHRTRSVWAGLRPAIMLGLLSLVLPLPWYLRSWIASGNPVFPELYSVFGAPPERWDAVTAAGLQRFLERFGLPRTPLNQLLLPFHVTLNADRYQGSLGPLFLLFLPLLLLRRMRGAVPWLLVFVIGFVAVWASPLASFQLRFLIPITPILAVLAAAAWSRLAALVRNTAGRIGARALVCATAFLLVLNLPFFTALHERNRVWIEHTLHGLPLGVVLGGESVDTYLGRTVYTYRAWQAINESASPDSRVLTWGGGDDLYTRHDRIWANVTIMRPIAWAKPDQRDQALQGLRDHGITHLLIDRRPPDSPDGWSNYALTDPETITRWYDELYTDDRYVVYALRTEPRP